MSKPTDIELTVGLEPSDIKGTAKELGKAIKNIFDKTAGADLDERMQKLQQRMSQTTSKAQSLMEKMTKLETTKIPTKEYAEVSKELERAKKKLDGLFEAQIRMEKAGEKSGAAWDRLSNNIDKVGDLIRKDEAELKQLVETGKAFTLGSDTEQYNNLGKQLADVNNQSRSLINTWDNMMYEEDEVIQKSSLLSTIWTGVVNAFRKVGSIIKSVFNAAVKIIGKTVDLFKKLISIIKSATSKIWQFAKSFGSVNNNAGGFNISLKRIMRSILGLGLGVYGLQSLFTKLRSAMSDGIKSVVLWEGANGRLNKSISSLKSAIATLKNSIGAMITPLVNALAPALTKIINLVTMATQRIGMFIAALTGQKTYLVANEVQEDYAAGLEATGKAAKKAKKELEGYLSPIDEINKYQSKAEDESGGGGIGGGGFKSVPIDSAMQDFIDRLKNMWKNADFTELGKEFGEKLLKALQNIPWAKIKRTARKLGSSLATFINGFVEVPDLGTTIGKTIAEGLNTAFEFVNEFVHKLHWKSIGQFIAETFNGFFDNIDWKLIADTIITGFRGLADALWQFISKFKWNNLSKAVSNLVNSLSRGVIEFFTREEYDERGFKKAGTWASRLGDEIGYQLRRAIEQIEWKDVGKALGSGLKSMFDFAVNFLKQQSWEDIKKAIRDTIEGLLEGLGFDDQKINDIMSWVDKVGGWLEKIYQWVQDVWTELKPILSEIWDAVEPLIEDLGKRLVDWLAELPEKLKEFKESELFQTMISKLKDLTADDIINGIEKLATALGVIVGLKIANDLVGNITGLFNAFTIISGSELGLIAAGLSGVAYAWTEINEALTEDASEEIKNRYSGLSGIVHEIADVVSGIDNWIKTGVFAPDERFEEDNMAYAKSLEECSVAIDKLTGSGENMKAFYQADEGVAGFFGKWTKFDKQYFDDLQEEFGFTDQQIGNLKKAMIDATYESGTFQGSLKDLADVIGYVPEKFEDVSKAVLTYTDAEGNVTEEYNRWGERIIRITDNTTTAVEEAQKKKTEALKKESDEWAKSHVSIMQEEALKAQGVTNVRQHVESEKKKEAEVVKRQEEITRSAVEDTRKIFENGTITIQDTTNKNATAVETNDKRIIESATKKATTTKNMSKEEQDAVIATAKQVGESTTVIETSFVEQEKAGASATGAIVGQQKELTKSVQDASKQMNTSTADSSKQITTSWSGMVQNIKSSVNSILGFVEKMVNGIIDAFNNMGNSLGSIDLDIPDWIPKIGGKKFEIGLPTLNHISIPRLAQGAVIPPNKEFLSVLGDQKSGTNIETPLSTMIDAFNQALSQNGGNNGQPIILNLVLPDKRTVAQYAIEGGQVLQMSRGRNPFLLERG